MRLAWVELRDFRNHAHTRIDPMPDGLLVAVGPNGEGKTNLLEGMHVLYALSSPRTATNEALVRDGAAHAYARGEFETREGRVLVEVEIPRRGAMRVQVNRSPVRRRRDLRRQVRAVLFGPFDLPIVIGDPSKRRGFLDEAVVALHPARDTLTSVTTVNVSMISLQESEVMKRLAAYAALVAVPTMIAGIYGMNFDFMPELQWKYGYFLSLGLMVVFDGLLFWKLRKERWL